MNDGKIKRLCSLLLCVFMTVSLLAGCAGGPSDAQALSAPEGTDTPEPTATPDTAEAPLDQNRAMGRYTEQTLPVPEGAARLGNLCRTSEGLWLFGGEDTPGAWFQPTGSDIWEERPLPEPIRSTYLVNSAVSEGGEMAFVCFEPDESGSYVDVIRTVDDGGNVTELDRGETMGNDMIYGPDGGLYVHRSGSACGVYRYSADAGEEKLFWATTMVDKLTFVGSKLLALDAGQVLIYDTEEETLLENDPVLDQFVSENLTGDSGYSGIHEAVLFSSGEDGVIYLSCAKGIYRHVLYGTVMEQLVDGALSSFGDPSKMQQNIVAAEEPDGSLGFEVLFFGPILVHFTYHADVPTVPEITLKVYSLEDNSAVRQAIAMFQQQYPQCYVQYEVALSGIGAANVDDKLKNLNTALLGGNGPDVLIMDGLEERNYSSKGILEDLSPLLDSLEGEDTLLPNVVEAVRKDGKIFSIPAGFAIPMVAVQEKYAQDTMDLEALARAAEQMRADVPQGPLFGSAIPERLLTVLAQTEAWSWVKDGALQETSLRDYLTFAQRIYQAETAGVTEQDIEKQRAELEAGYGPFHSFGSSLVSVLLNERKIALGYVNSAIDLCWADQLEEDYVLRPVADGKGVGFMPLTSLAINSQSAQKEMAQAFVRMMLSFRFQSLNTEDGTPVNQAALEQWLEGDPDYSLGIAGTDSNGNYVDLSATWPSEQTIKQYREMIGKMDHTLAYNRFLENKVVEVGAQALGEGAAAKEETMDEIRRKTALYLAE